MKKLRVRMPDGQYEFHDFIDWYEDGGRLIVRRAHSSSMYAIGGWWEITEFGDE